METVFALVVLPASIGTVVFLLLTILELRKIKKLMRSARD